MARFLPARWVWWYRDKRCAMGYSKRIYNDKKWNKTVAPLRPTFESLGLKEDDVARLHEQFLRIDKDGSGTIELWEMLDHLDLKRNRFAKRVFAIFDVDGSRTRSTSRSSWSRCGSTARLVELSSSCSRSTCTIVIRLGL